MELELQIGFLSGCHVLCFKFLTAAPPITQWDFSLPELQWRINSTRLTYFYNQAEVLPCKLTFHFQISIKISVRSENIVIKPPTLWGGISHIEHNQHALLQNMARPVVEVLIPRTEILYVALPTNNSSGERVQAKSPIFSLTDTTKALLVSP